MAKKLAIVVTGRNRVSADHTRVVAGTVAAYNARLSEAGQRAETAVVAGNTVTHYYKEVLGQYDLEFEEAADQALAKLRKVR